MSLVSVIMPYYKKKKYVLESIKSILNQSHKNLEIILVNDEIDNKSCDFLKEISILDSRIKLIINAKEFLSLRDELRENILIKCIKYVHKSSFQIRSKKIENLLKKIYEFKNISLNSNKTSINRIDNKILISKN